MKAKKNIASGLFFFFLLHSGYAGETDYPAIKAGVSQETSTVGSVIDYKITIAGKNLSDLEILKPGETVFYPEKDNKGNSSSGKEKKGDDNPSREVPLYIIHDAKKEDSSAESTGYITLTVKISYYRPGKHLLPEIIIYGKDRVRIGYKVPEVLIKPVNEKSEFAEIEPPLDLQGNYYRLIYIGIALIILTLAVVLLVKYIRKRRVDRIVQPPAVPPIDIFLRELDALDAPKLISQGKIEEYIVGISMLFRRFLSMEYGIDAAEMTSDEIDAMLSRIMPRHLYETHTGRMMKCFLLWDLSKFAEFAPSEEILTVNYEGTRKLAIDLSGESAHA